MSGEMEEEKRMLLELSETAEDLQARGVISDQELKALHFLCSVPFKELDQGAQTD